MLYRHEHSNSQSSAASDIPMIATSWHHTNAGVQNLTLQLKPRMPPHPSIFPPSSPPMQRPSVGLGTYPESSDPAATFSMKLLSGLEIQKVAGRSSLSLPGVLGGMLLGGTPGMRMSTEGEGGRGDRGRLRGERREGAGEEDEKGGWKGESRKREGKRNVALA